ncbi:hypothetical protein HPP92_025549 [Vanilla planifolia]|uniref:Uncharacterized protein n=1 Tax=Vanilla planifolia TaxID=51239 RepID=A0A835PFK8_VANPL|nr:hypothetical protein HPP92_025549 [Vanilla planifolia]
MSVLDFLRCAGFSDGICDLLSKGTLSPFQLARRLSSPVLVLRVKCFRLFPGCVYVMNSITEYFSNGGKVIFMLVEAIDIYLIGTVMLVFGMGLYELFISNFDVAKNSSHGSSFIGLFKLPERPKWLEIQSVQELKTKLGHVIVLVLLIGLFDKSDNNNGLWEVKGDWRRHVIAEVTSIFFPLTFVSLKSRK